MRLCRRSMFQTPAHGSVREADACFRLTYAHRACSMAKSSLITRWTALRAAAEMSTDHGEVIALIASTACPMHVVLGSYRHAARASYLARPALCTQVQSATRVHAVRRVAELTESMSKGGSPGDTAATLCSTEPMAAWQGSVAVVELLLACCRLRRGVVELIVIGSGRVARTAAVSVDRRGRRCTDCQPCKVVR